MTDDMKILQVLWRLSDGNIKKFSHDNVDLIRTEIDSLAKHRHRDDSIYTLGEDIFGNLSLDDFSEFVDGVYYYRKITKRGGVKAWGKGA